MNVSVRSAVIGALASKTSPSRLAEIYKELKEFGLSKATIYRHLQKLVDENMVEKQADSYFLLQRGKSIAHATDILRLSAMTPKHRESWNGLAFSVYGNVDRNEDWERVREPLRSKLVELLDAVFPTLDLPDSTRLTSKQIQNLLGKKVGLVVTFDGTALTTLSPEALREKSRLLMKLLAENKVLTDSEIRDKFELNELQLRQVLHPLIASGYATLNDEGKLTYTMEVTPD